MKRKKVIYLIKLVKEIIQNGELYKGYKLSLYENGISVQSSYLNIERLEMLKKFLENGGDTFFLGCLRNYDNGVPCNEYGKMVLKNCRFYTRPLSDDEIKLNYDTRLAYDKDNSES